MDQFTIRNTISLAIFSIALASFISFDYIDSYVISYFIEAGSLDLQLYLLLKASSLTILFILVLTPKLFKFLRLTQVAMMAYLFAGILIGILCISDFLNFYFYLIIVTFAKASLYSASLAIISVSVENKVMPIGRLAAYLTGSYHFALFVFNSLAQIVINPLRSSPFKECNETYCPYDKSISVRFKIYIKSMLIVYIILIILAFVLFNRKRPQTNYQRISVNYSQYDSQANLKKPFGPLYVLLIISAFLGNLGSKTLQINAQVIMSEVLLDPSMAHLLFIMTDSFKVFSSVVWGINAKENNIDQIIWKIQLVTSIGVIATGVSGSQTIICCFLFISTVMVSNALILTQISAIFLKASKQQYQIQLPIFAVSCYISMMIGEGISKLLLQASLSQLQSISILGMISTVSQISLQKYSRKKLQMEQQSFQ